MNIQPLFKTASAIGQVYRILSTGLLIIHLFRRHRR